MVSVHIEATDQHRHAAIATGLETSVQKTTHSSASAEAHTMTVSSGCSSSAATDHMWLHFSSAPLLQLCVDGGKLLLCSRLAPPPPRAPKPHPHRSVTRADLALRPNEPNGPKKLRRRVAPNDSPSPNALPTRDRHAPEPPSAYASPTSQPVTIQRLGGPASHAAQV